MPIIFFPTKFGKPLPNLKGASILLWSRTNIVPTDWGGMIWRKTFIMQIISRFDLSFLISDLRCKWLVLLCFCLVLVELWSDSGWAIAHYQPLVCTGWRSSTKWWHYFFPFFQSFGGKFWCKWIIKFLRRLNVWHLQFLNFKKCWSYWKNCCTSAQNFNFKCQFNLSDLFKAQSLIICQEIYSWKPLFQEDLTLLSLDFYEVIVDSDFGLINYHLIEILSTYRNLIFK